MAGAFLLRRGSRVGREQSERDEAKFVIDIARREGIPIHIVRRDIVGPTTQAETQRDGVLARHQQLGAVMASSTAQVTCLHAGYVPIKTNGR